MQPQEEGHPVDTTRATLWLILTLPLWAAVAVTLGGL